MGMTSGGSYRRYLLGILLAGLGRRLATSLADLGNGPKTLETQMVEGFLVVNFLTERAGVVLGIIQTATATGQRTFPLRVLRVLRVAVESLCHKGGQCNKIIERMAHHVLKMMFTGAVQDNRESQVRRGHRGPDCQIQKDPQPPQNEEVKVKLGPEEVTAVTDPEAAFQWNLEETFQRNDLV